MEITWGAFLAVKFLGREGGYATFYSRKVFLGDL